MITKKIDVKLPNFAEARPVAIIVQIASQFESKIYIVSGSKRINAKSIMGMMSISIVNAGEIEIEADGPDEEKAVEAIINYINSLAA